MTRALTGDRPAAAAPAGFTLLEMLLVLLLLGVAAGVSVPAFRDWAEPDPLLSAAAEVAGVLESARRVALERGAVVEVAFATERGGYSAWVRGAAAAALGDGSLERLGDARLAGAGERPRYRFDPVGTASGAPLVVTRAGRIVRVEVDRWTGKVSVHAM
jgi:prepilin-type N-terminal cleavage/methylation domain-containing protein